MNLRQHTWPSLVAPSLVAPSLVAPSLMALSLMTGVAAQPQGTGYEDAAGNYAAMAASGGELSQLQRRLKVAQERVVELTADVGAASERLVILDRREMEELIFVRQREVVEDREAELAKIQRTYAQRRARQQDDRAAIQADLERAGRDVAQLRLEVSRAETDRARNGTGARSRTETDAARSAELRIRSYLAACAAQLGAPRIEPVPRAWVAAESRVEP
ncbi:MAG: hypothetical protein AAF628_09260 [Planctomycetota bacterium]